MESRKQYARDMRKIQKARDQIRKAFEGLVRMTANQSYETRMEALQALNDSELDLEPHVGKALRDRDELVRTTAAEIAGERKLISLQDKLIRQLKSDRSVLARSAAAVALGEMRASKARNILRSGITASGAEEQVGLFYALVRLGAGKYFSSFLEGLKHDSYRVRCATANLLPDLIDEKNRSATMKSLREALAREQTVAARSSFNYALNEISAWRKRGS